MWRRRPDRVPRPRGRPASAAPCRVRAPSRSPAFPPVVLSLFLFSPALSFFLAPLFSAPSSSLLRCSCCRCRCCAGRRRRRRCCSRACGARCARAAPHGPWRRSLVAPVSPPAPGRLGRQVGAASRSHARPASPGCRRQAGRFSISRAVGTACLHARPLRTTGIGVGGRAWSRLSASRPWSPVRCGPRPCGHRHRHHRPVPAWLELFMLALASSSRPRVLALAPLSALPHRAVCRVSPPQPSRSSGSCLSPLFAPPTSGSSRSAAPQLRSALSLASPPSPLVPHPLPHPHPHPPTTSSPSPPTPLHHYDSSPPPPPLTLPHHPITHRLSHPIFPC